ncbi:MAG: LysR family transcriptional regulator [Oscillospiraceae bacterium]|nr:LysR family transcriptional regulator [Oscillospiraceae bacterium]
MELRNLITFTHVADLGSFTKAAEELGYSQSTISFQIKQLEEELGCLLFERINHTVKLTARGHELVSYAHQVRTLTEEFKENLTQTEPIGEIHIVTPDSICEELIDAHYMEFHRRYPCISVKFTTADTSVMFDMLDRNAADVILTLDAHSYHKDYVIAKEEQISMHFVAAANSKFAGVSRVSIFDLAQEKFILTEHGQGYRRVFDKELSRKSINITPVLEIGRTDIITSLVAQSDMISYLPDFVTKSAIEAGKLCYLDICDFEIEIWKQLIHHKNKWLSKSLKALIDYIKETEFGE